MSTVGFEFVEHTADWAIRLRGRDLTELLANAAHGMNSLLLSDARAIPGDQERQIELEAFDAESLLVEWLTELAYWAESELLLFREFILSEVSDTHLKATLKGGNVVDLEKHVKAVTYHNLSITQTDHGLEATVVFDV